VRALERCIGSGVTFNQVLTESIAGPAFKFNMLPIRAIRESHSVRALMRIYRWVRDAVLRPDECDRFGNRI